MRKAWSLILGCVCAALAACADTVALVKAGWVNPFDGANWSDGEVPHSDATYCVTSGYTLLTTTANATSPTTFNGGCVTIDGGSIVFYGKNTANFPNGIVFRRGSGSVNFGYSGTTDAPTLSVTDHHYVTGPITVLSETSAPQMSVTYRSNGQHLHLLGALTGDANTGLAFNGNEWSNLNTNNFTFFDGDLTGYHGYLKIADGGRTHCFGFGPSPLPGSVILDAKTNAFLRTASVTNDAFIATLSLAANSSLYPQIDLQHATNGTLRVTKKLTYTAPIHVCARFLTPLLSQYSAEHRFPLLACPASAGTLTAADFDLVAMDAGEIPAGCLSLDVQNDAQGVPTLYLVKAEVSVPVTLVTSDGEKESAFLADYAAHWSPAGVPVAGHSYRVANGKTLRTPYFQPVSTKTDGVPGADQTFAGDALYIGDAATAGTVSHWGYNKVIIPRLVIENGSYACCGNWSGNRHSWLDAPIEIRATDPAKAVFKTGTTWQHLYLLGRVTGTASAACRMFFTNGNSEMYPQGDWSGFYGLLDVACSGAGSVGNVQFGPSTVALPGTLRLGTTTSDVGTYKITAEGGLSVGTLIINRPATLSVGVNAQTFAASPIVVTNRFEQQADVSLSIAASGDILTRVDNLSAAFIPILKVKKMAGTIDAARFKLGALTGASYTPAGLFEIEVRESGDEYILGLAKRTVVYLTQSDDATIDSATGAKSCRTSFDEKWVASDGDNTGRTDGWNWNVNERPHYENDYYAGNALRTHSSRTAVFFQGHALFLRADLTLQSTETTVSNLYLIGGALNHAHHGGYSASRYPQFDFLGKNGLVRELHGKATVHTKSTIKAPHQNYPDGLLVDMEFSGSAQLSVQRTGNSSPYSGHAILAGDNSRFTGILELTDQSSSSFSDSQHLVTLFTEQKNLGGDLAAFTYNGLILTRNATLRPLGSATLAFANRAICIEGLGGLEAASGTVFTVETPLVYRGTLVKYGKGLLRLGTVPKFLPASGSTVSATPTANLNVLRVAAGSIGVTAPLACDGVKIQMEEGATLSVPLGACSDAVAAQGVKNVKTDEPFALEGTDGKLHVEFDATGFVPVEPQVVRRAICTVTTAAAENLRGKIVFEKSPVKGYCARLEDEGVDASAGTVTFSATFRPAGFVVLIR